MIRIFYMVLLAHVVRMQLSSLRSLSNIHKLLRASSVTWFLGSPHFSDFGNETCARGGSDLSMKWQCLEVYYLTSVWELFSSCDLTNYSNNNNLHLENMFDMEPALMRLSTIVDVHYGD